MDWSITERSGVRGTLVGDEDPCVVTIVTIKLVTRKVQFLC